MVVFARRPKKVAVITRWLYYRGGCKAGFHCKKFKKLRKVYNLPFFSVLGHFFYPKFPLTSLTKIPSVFLFSVSVYLKEINTKNNVKYLYQNNTTCITWLYCNSLVRKKLESLRQFSGSALQQKIFKKWKLLLSSNKAVIQVLEAQKKIKLLSLFTKLNNKLKCKEIIFLTNILVYLLVTVATFEISLTQALLCPLKDG